MEKLWYKKPASIWHHALPLGNGKIGVMLYGGKDKETLAFNDATLWSGYPKDQTNPDSAIYLNEVRQLIFEENYGKAEKLAEEKLCGDYSEAYLPLGNLYLDFSKNKSKYSDYRRELDISTAEHTVSFSGGSRKTFASYPDRVVVYKITTDKPSSVTITADSPLSSGTCYDSGTFLLAGYAPDYAAPNYVKINDESEGLYYDKEKGMSFCLALKVSTNGKKECYNDKLVISAATETIILATTETGFLGYDKMPVHDVSYAVKLCKNILKEVSFDFEKLEERHLKDYRNLYERHLFSLGGSFDGPTDELIKIKDTSASKALIELLYNYGKYLTISGSRTGGQPTTLQGLWNAEVRPPWSSNYTVNINTQMNYWHASQVNLSECIEPLVTMVSEITEAGKHTADINLNCSGSCCNHNVDLWRKTTPVKGSTAYMYAPLCGVWLTNEVYAHYQNGGLDSYREEIVEAVKQSALFLLDYLVDYNGYYVPCPSVTPEAIFLHKGKICALDYATSYELGLIRQLFKNLLECSDDKELSARVREKLDNLFPFSADKTGILEWHKTLLRLEKGHRHFSPIYAFYPANVIRYYSDPIETEWVSTFFKYRLAHSTQNIGWNAAWGICIAGRLHDKDAALGLINKMLSTSIFPNLFDYHPPRYFQIDGNFGFVAGINELLIYVENDIIELLPALPDTMKSGIMYGYVYRGINLSLEWKNGLITKFYSDKPVKLLNKKLSSNCVVPTYVTLVDSII